MKTLFRSSLLVTALLSCALVLPIRSSAEGTQVTLPVNSANSTLTVTLCADPGVGQSCDTDSASVTGFLVASFDDNEAPGAITVRNFDLQASRSLNLNLSWLFGLARLDATANGLGLSHASPGGQNPFFPVSAGVFTAVEVPYQARGLANYNATGLACTALQNSGQPCSGAFDLATNGPGTIASAPGTVQVNNGVATVHLDITVTQYLDESNPSMGTITIHAVVNASAPVPSALIPFGSDWRYLDDGSNQGTPWREPGFGDSGWLVGPAELGYGDGGEATINYYGLDPNNKFLTTYYRHSFRVPDPGIYGNLVLRLLRDDGAVVYLNGQEVFRSNMPETPIDWATLAGVAASGLEETIYFARHLDPSLLWPGINELAVEVHQSSGGSSDLSFDLELQGNFTFSNLPPTVAIASPTNGSVLPSTSFSLTAAASDPDGVITLVEFFQDGVLLGTAKAAPWTVTVPALCPGSYSFTAQAWDNSETAVVSAPVTVNVIRPTTVLVARGSEWKYLDNGTDAGRAWRGLAFNDTAWKSGPAELGYGDGGEATTNLFGPDPNNRYVTTYYRRKFTVADPGPMLGLALHLLRDDGAVVYINSNEVFRVNLPAGEPAYNTYANGTVSGSDETTYFTSYLSASSLVAGTNILAVEMHQVSSNSTDISFDLDLEAGFANQAPLVAITNPPNGGEIPAGAPLLIQAAAIDVDGQVTLVEFYEGANKLGEATAPPFEVRLPSYPSGRYYLAAQAYDDCGGISLSPPVQVSIGAFSMIHTGAVWKYQDNGVYPGAGWTAVGYDDSRWPSGPAELGYGDGYEATTNLFGSDPNNKYLTTWYRRSWEVLDKALVTGLTVRLLRDDGAVVYLNGTEVFRSNMPGGPISPGTLATNGVAGDEEQAWFSQPVSPARLRDGPNTLAVEIHQVSTNSTDISFNLELIAAVIETTPTVQIDSSSGPAVVRWPSSAVGFRLYQTHDLRPEVQWELAPVPVQDDGTWRSVIIPVGPLDTFYRVGW